MQFEMSAKASDYVRRVRSFIDTHIAPMERDYWARIHDARHGGDHKTWMRAQ